jgi:hypothetical protein
MVRGSYERQSEPTLELCMKIQRSTGVNGMKSRTLEASIRVVPPIFWPLEIIADFKGIFISLKSA